MRFDIKKEGVTLLYKNKEYFLSLEELREFKIEIELIPSNEKHEEYYWLYSTNDSQEYYDMSALVFCDLEDALRKKIHTRKKKSIAK